ncbi:hypothetical protein QYF61_004806 [Mycteria americana]|uniref:Uncharacterized protein n=1 Tax=Mycteria americana TaxID=33587 RepID=A0AAN7N0U9_MYCAM|nr:hypothetical protein QYF61_004806 [Mycteria americana]
MPKGNLEKSTRSQLLKSQKEKRCNGEGGLQAGIREGGQSTFGVSQVRLRVQRGAWLRSKQREGTVSHRLVERTAKCVRASGEKTPDRIGVLQSTSPKLNPAQDLRFSLHTELRHTHTESQNRIGWKRPLRSSSPTVNLTLPRPPLHHVPKHLIQTSFKYLQGWRLNHFPGQPGPMLDNPFSEIKFPNIQSKPPLAQLEAISPHPITCYLGEETDPHLSTTSFQAKQPQLPQPLLIRLVLQTLHQLRCPSLDTLQHLNVSLVVGGPKLNTVFEVRPHQCQVQGHDHFPSPAGHAISDTSQDAIGFLGRLGTLLAHIQPAVNQHPQVLLYRAAFQPLFPKPVALHGVAVAQVQDLALGLVKPHTIDLGPSIQPVQVPLQSLPTLQQINTPAQLGVICKCPTSANVPHLNYSNLAENCLEDWSQLSSSLYCKRGSGLCGFQEWDASTHLCLNFPGFGSKGTTGVASVRRCQKLHPCWTEPDPAGSKTDPPLAKAEPISNSGSTSVITYLRMGKNCSWERGVRIRERNNPADTKVSGEGGGGDAPGAGAEIALQPTVKTMVRQAVPPQPMEVHGEAGGCA